MERYTTTGAGEFENGDRVTVSFTHTHTGKESELTAVVVPRDDDETTAGALALEQKGSDGYIPRCVTRHGEVRTLDTAHDDITIGVGATVTPAEPPTPSQPIDAFAEGDEVRVVYEGSFFSGREREVVGEVVDVNDIYMHRTPQEDALDIRVCGENGRYIARVFESGRLMSLNHATRRHDHRMGSGAKLFAVADEADEQGADDDDEPRVMTDGGVDEDDESRSPIDDVLPETWLTTESDDDPEMAVCPVCGDEFNPRSDRTELNLGKPDYCNLACRLEAEDDEPEVMTDGGEDACERCGGTGRVMRVVHGREGLVSCPVCETDPEVRTDGGIDDERVPVAITVKETRHGTFYTVGVDSETTGLTATMGEAVKISRWGEALVDEVEARYGPAEDQAEGQIATAVVDSTGNPDDPSTWEFVETDGGMGPREVSLWRNYREGKVGIETAAGRRLLTPTEARLRANQLERHVEEEYGGDPATDQLIADLRAYADELAALDSADDEGEGEDDDGA